MAIGGYVLVDCQGLNLLAQESQTIAGIYAACNDAVKSGKPIITTNCEYGEDVPMTPISVMAIIEDGVIIFTASILQIRVSSDDSIVITSLLTPAQSTRAKKA